MTVSSGLKISGLAAVDASGNKIYYIQNPRGDVANLLDKDGNILRAYTYDPFGKALGVQVDSNGSRFDGTNEVYSDDKSGLIYIHNRWYNADLGRFISRDPKWLSGGFNLYVYCNNNPMLNVDFTGLWSTDSSFGQTGDSYTYNCLLDEAAAMPNESMQQGAYMAASDYQAQMDGGVYASWDEIALQAMESTSDIALGMATISFSLDGIAEGAALSYSAFSEIGASGASLSNVGSATLGGSQYLLGATGATYAGQDLLDGPVNKGMLFLTGGASAMTDAALGSPMVGWDVISGMRDFGGVTWDVVTGGGAK